MSENTAWEMQLLCTGIGDIYAGMRLTFIMEIVREAQIVPVPRIPDYYEGVCNWKGHVLPVINPGRLSGRDDQKDKSEQVIVVVRSGVYEFGFLANEEPEILSVSEDQRLSGDLPESLGGILSFRQAYCHGEKVILQVDIDETIRNLVNGVV